MATLTKGSSGASGEGVPVYVDGIGASKVLRVDSTGNYLQSFDATSGDPFTQYQLESEKNAASGYAALNASSAVQVPAGNLTAGTMTMASTSPVVVGGWNKFSWTNAMVVALGASTDMTICTLPAKSVVKRAVVVIGTAATQAATLTVSVGRTATGYIDYVVASNAKAAANTIYGDAAAEQGTGLKSDVLDIPSWTATTPVIAQFLIGAGTNADVLTSTGSVYLYVDILP